MIRAVPRKNVNGDTRMRACRIPTSHGTRSAFCSSNNATGSRRPTSADHCA